MIDILLEEGFDLSIAAGDFVIGESTQQHQQLLLLLQKGELKQSPLVGVGLLELIEDEESAAINKIIKDEFEKDGMTVSVLKIIDKKIHIEAKYD